MLTLWSLFIWTCFVISSLLAVEFFFLCASCNWVALHKTGDNITHGNLIFLSVPHGCFQVVLRECSWLIVLRARRIYLWPLQAYFTYFEFLLSCLYYFFLISSWTYAHNLVVIFWLAKISCGDPLIDSWFYKSYILHEGCHKMLPC